MPLTKERLSLAIDRYEEEFVRYEVSEITTAFIWKIVYIVVLIFCGILTNLKPSWNSVIGTLGLGGLSVKASIKSVSEAWEKFRNDRRLLMTSVTYLRVRLDLCSGDDESCLKDVESSIRQYLEEARK